MGFVGGGGVSALVGIAGRRGWSEGSVPNEKGKSGIGESSLLPFSGGGGARRGICFLHSRLLRLVLSMTNMEKRVRTVGAYI